ncbi:hypothetical protein BDN72DRAFT_210649 [Pluteus cervinus]|uniref:Uncharacterized protein n=1 Tax=Pluteus cervinus TaxID=181527 RepID=A0ACD3AHI1_9AGAR|nr:hypothetical protein BDN72DRAFT_210649 [Pluteus cervinus]
MKCWVFYKTRRGGEGFLRFLRIGGGDGRRNLEFPPHKTLESGLTYNATTTLMRVGPRGASASSGCCRPGSGCIVLMGGLGFLKVRSIRCE